MGYNYLLAIQNKYRHTNNFLLSNFMPQKNILKYFLQLVHKQIYKL
jgi:hypothetical protein